MDRQLAMADLLKEADRYYQEGKTEKAREVILSADEALFYEPAVHAYFVKLSPIGIANDANQSRMTWESNSLIPEVQAYVNYYQGQGRNHVRISLTRLEQYESMMREIFRQEGVPEELIYLGLVESAYNPYARSSAGAEGIWQFIPETGRRYGLQEIGKVDERHDPVKSSRAAARYLKDLHGMLGDWLLALAGYNTGEYRVLRIIQNTGIRDFWKMSRQKLLPEETRNYVPAVLAAIAVGKNQSKPNLEWTRLGF
ncbi:MAG: lytic transglycosylase domain-containing protein [Acidobacteriota bacterium]